jgi:hypothetical protein
MKSIAGVIVVLLAGCAGRYPPPSEPLARAESASRDAAALGARRQPQAAVFLKVADDRIAEARQLIAADDNEHATVVITRAAADAEVALQLAKESKAEAEATAAVARARRIEAETQGLR